MVWQCPTRASCPPPWLVPSGAPTPVLIVCLHSQQMDDAVYTFETLLHQELGKLQGKDDLCKSIQRILERVLKVRGGGVGAFGDLQWPCSKGWQPGEEARSDLTNFNKSLLGKCFFILRLFMHLAGMWGRRVGNHLEEPGPL